MKAKLAALLASIVIVLFWSAAFAKDHGDAAKYTRQDSADLEATAKLSAIGDKHFCKVFVCKHHEKAKRRVSRQVLKEVPDIIKQAYDAVIEKEVQKRLRQRQ